MTSGVWPWKEIKKERKQLSIVICCSFHTFLLRSPLTYIPKEKIESKEDRTLVTSYYFYIFGWLTE